MTNSPLHRRVVFELVRDEDGYPPADSETLWAIHREDGYEIDNIPFFTHAVALGDLVSVIESGGELRYDRTVYRSMNSLVRVILSKGTDPAIVRDQLARFGCSSEFDEHHALIAVNVGPECDISLIRAYLNDQFESGMLDYEEAILRQ